MKRRQFAITLGLTVGAITCSEALARAYLVQAYLSKHDIRITEAPTLAETIKSLANAAVAGRELDNRYTVSNIAKLSRHPQRESITTAFLGTSRTKILNPALVGWQNVVVSAGNSYNEISYSYLIEASFLKQQFPNLQYVFVETSLLNRQEPPPAFIVSSDHRKYLPFLVSLQAELSATPSAASIATLLEQQLAQSQAAHNRLGSQLFQQKEQFKISTLLGLNETQQKMPVRETDVFKQMNENGVQTDEIAFNLAEIQADSPKITRLVDIKSRYPWDEQFTALADWAKVKGVTLVFFQPPVRSDFYAFQVQYGLEMHRQDIAALAQASGFPFIDLNMQSLQYASDWSLFSDADHLGSCKGRYVYAAALQLGFNRWQAQGQRLQPVTRTEAIDHAQPLTAACG